ncbi:MAG: hypothetical protein HRU20_11255 [Pseudomonadales bacterium]|nr:hypothetical protein [Pseudomonadales bacterium]
MLNHTQCHEVLEAETLESGVKGLQDIIDKIEQDDAHKLYCSQCHQAITSLKNKTHIQGQFLHERINPAGFQFLIGCFHQSLGCDVAGQTSMEYTWFDGFHWQQCQCSQCEQAMGWYFSRYNQHFYALIMRHLACK